MNRYWCELAWLSGTRADAGVVIDVAGGLVEDVCPGVTTPPSGAERLHGLTIPGLANAHSHAFQRALRGRTHARRGSFWTWRKQMYELVGALDPDAFRALARATFAEMALAGVTLVGEFHYLHHAPGGASYSDPNAMGHAVIEAAQAVGIRVTLLDTCYLHGGIGKEPDPVQARFSDGDAEAWAQRVGALEDGPGVRIGAAIHSVRAVDPDAAGIVASWATQRTRPLHAHVSEQAAENEACLAAHGCTPTALLASAGVLSERFTAVHATHLFKADVELLGAAGVCCCLCPTTERDLADGVGRAARLHAAGARLALGSDSNAVVDLFEEARAVELDQRLVTGIRGQHPAADLLRAATEEGYVSLGWPRGGRIEPGALADLTTVGLDSVRLAGTPAEHAVAAVVFAGAAPDVRHVMADGRWIVRDGAHVRLDVAAELRDALAVLAR